MEEGRGRGEGGHTAALSRGTMEQAGPSNIICTSELFWFKDLVFSTMAACAALERAPLASLLIDAKDLDRLTCPICADVMETAFMPGCQHTACWTCWQRTEETVCPFCRVLFHECDLVVCRHLVSCLAEANVRCPFSCGWTGEHQMLAGHEDECPILQFGKLQQELEEKNAQIASLSARYDELHARLERVRACVGPADGAARRRRGRRHFRILPVSFSGRPPPAPSPGRITPTLPTCPMTPEWPRSRSRSQRRR